MLDAAVRFCHALLLQFTLLQFTTIERLDERFLLPKGLLRWYVQFYAVEVSAYTQAQLPEQVRVMEKLD
jgi:hypothetical protein